MERQPTKNILSDAMAKYGTITAYSGCGGTIYPWEREQLKHYRNCQIVSLWIDPVDCHAYIKIK